jgi:hypothetical protein
MKWLNCLNRKIFHNFNTTIREMCSEVRRTTWKIEPSAEFDFDGEYH